MLNVTTFPGAQLGPGEVTGWRELLKQLPWIDSPYFQPEFTRFVAAVRPDVEVAFLELDGKLAGIFPYQRGRFGRGNPVGGRLSDFHGIIGDPRTLCEIADLLPACRLRSFQFDHLLLNHFPQGDSPAITEGSPYISMPNGFDEYIKTQRTYSKHLSQYQRKLNKIQRELGEIRLEMESRSESDFQQLLAWKQEQYRRTGAFNPLRFSWTIDLLRKIWDASSECFRGAFSTLHVGEKLVGAHFGMRSASTLHYWFPAYNPEFHNYSPGNLLLLEIARAGSDAGITKIDLGKGTEDYKLAFGSAQTLVVEGSVYQPCLLNSIDSTCQRAKAWLKSSALSRPATATAKALRPLREWLAFR